MKPKRIIRQFFTKNLKIKIFSLLCASFLWFYVTRENQVENTFQIPLVVINQPEDKILVKSLPEVIPVVYHGPSGALSPRVDDHRIQIDLEKYPNNTEVTLTLDMIQTNPSKTDIIPIQILWDDPIVIAYDQYITKKVPVVSDIVFKPKQGYTQVGDVVLTPDSVILSGAAREVNRIDAIYTETKMLQVFRPIQGEIALVDSTTSFVSLSETQVQFSADFQGIGDRMFSDVPVQVIHAPPGFKVSSVPSVLSLRLQGGVEVLKTVKRDDIVATIDYQSRYRYGRRIPAMIHVPPHISFTDVKPRDFELLVER